MPAKSTEFKSSATNPNIPSVKDVSSDEVKQKLAEIKIIDVRRPDEWVGEFGHIENAQLLTLDTLPARLTEVPKDQTVVFVCRSGGRSAQATAFAMQNGYKNVYNMRGGMMEWTAKSFSTVNTPAERNN